MKPKNKFIVVENPEKILNNSLIEKRDVGMLMDTKGDNFYIFFIRVGKKYLISKDAINFIDVTKTGDNFKYKICNVCHKLKKTTEFEKNQNGKDNRSVRRPSCKTCRITMNGIGISISDRKQWLKKKPNLEPFQCPICKKRTIAGITSKVVLEHNHLTGKVGAWICDSCNTGLGRFKDDINLLKNAIEFIKKNY